MLDKIINFYKSNKYVILWTVGYFIATWAIMKYMFDFNIFSRIRWWQLAHAHIHGFAGMVFGILILAAVPMYIATTIVIARTKAPLFTIKIPEFIKNAFIQTPMEEDVVDAPVPSETNTETTESPELNNDNIAEPTSAPIPAELRVAYARAREHISRTPTSAFDLGNVTKQKKSNNNIICNTNDTNTQDIPIPTDFDIDDTDDVVNTVPQFSDINFDDDDDTEIEINDIQQISDTVNPITEYMKSQSVPYTIDDDVVVTDKFAIVSHDDADFWVADADNWFAAGKTRKSPIELVKRIATKHGVQPILYLGANNIMDIETMIPQWESDGIHVITNLKDLK